MLYTKELEQNIKDKIALLTDAVSKVEDDKEWAFDVIATTQDADRDNEVIKVNGRDTKNWEKNPVVLANHNYTIESIIGKGTKFYTSKGVKRMKGVFSKTNPLGVLARNLYNEGMLKTVSVWFIPLKRNEQDYKIIERAELLEVSFVAVPCNPGALSLDGKLYEEAISKGLIIKEQAELTIKDVYAELQEIKSFIKGLADDKVANEELEAQAQEALDKKALLQEINKATASALEKLKRL